MRLGEFIRANHEPILSEWETFARTCVPVGASMDVEALRDHAKQMLVAFADDLSTPQSPEQQSE